MRFAVTRGSVGSTVRWSVLLMVLLAAAAAAAQSSRSVDRSSPRAAFDTFLGAMVEVKQGDTSRLEDAVACLDLSALPRLVRADAGPKLARDLKNFLDKVERIDVSKIPEAVEGTRWVYLRNTAGEVSVTRDDEGLWRFSAATMESLPALLDSVKGREFVAGIEGGGGVVVGFAGWLRTRLPESMLNRVFLLENWQWLGLLILALLGVVVDQFVRWIVGAWLRRLLARSERLRQKDLDANFARPLGILVMALTWWALLRLLDLPLNALTALKFATQLVMAAAGVWAAYRLVDVLSAHFMASATRTDTRVDDILVPMLRRALKIVIVAFGVLFVAQNLDIDVTSLLAGLGLGGLAFALAAKDTVENLFGSFTVLIDRPFQIGDWVVIGELEGTVEQIGFRSTRVRTFYNSLITIPNSNLVNTAVDNLGVRSYRRLKCMIGVQYDTPAERLEAFCEGIRELIRKHPYTRKDYYMVYFNEFADSSLNILLYTFFGTPDWATELRERHRLLVDIVRLAHRLGVEFAFPTQTLHLASAPPLTTRAAEESAREEPGPPADLTTTSHEQAISLGRREAEAILRGTWGEQRQPPVDFGDPERIRTAKD